MAVTPRGVFAAFTILDDAGKRRPSTWTDESMGRVIASWVRELAALTDEDLIEAVRVIAHTTDPFWPVMGAVLARVPRFGDPESGPRCWTALIAAVRVRGYSAGAPLYLAEHPAEDDAAEDALDSVGGWGSLCQAGERDLPHLRRTFIAEYRQQLVSRREAASRPILTSTPANPQIEDRRK